MGWPPCYRHSEIQLCWCNFFQKAAAFKSAPGSFRWAEYSEEKTRDKLFDALGYYCLLWRSVAYTEEQRSAKTKKVLVEKSKLPRKWPDSTLDFSHWRRISVSQLYRAGIKSSFLSHDILASTGVLSIFGHVTVIEVLHEYMGYMHQVVNSLQDTSSYIDVSVLALARLDTFIATVL